VWVLTDKGSRAVNLDHIEQLVVEQRDKEWMVKGMDRYASYFWFGPFESETAAKNFLNSITAAANSGRPDPMRLIK